MTATNETETETTTPDPPEGGSKGRRSRKPPETPEAAAASPSDVSTPAVDDDWDWEFVPEGVTGPDGTPEEFIVISPRDVIVPPFDARAADGVLTDDFRKSIADRGIDTPVLVAPVRHKKKPDRVGYALIAGRRRVRAAKEAGNARNRVIPARVHPVKDWSDALEVAATENLHREPMRPWDFVLYCKKMLDRGHSQTQIAERIHVSNANVSKFLQVLDLDPRIQRLVRSGKLDTTKTREIARLRDPSGAMLHDEQVDLANKAIERGFRAEDIRYHVENKKADLEKKAKEARTRARSRKAAPDGAGEEEAAKPASDKPYFDRASIAQPKKVVAHLLAEWARKTLQDLRAKEADPLKIRYQEGVVEGMKYQLGLKSPPKALGDEGEE